MSNEIFDGHLQFHFTTVDLVAMVLRRFSSAVKKRVVYWFRDVNEEGTISSETIGRVRLDSEGKAVNIT